MFNVDNSLKITQKEIKTIHNPHLEVTPRKCWCGFCYFSVYVSFFFFKIVIIMHVLFYNLLTYEYIIINLIFLHFFCNFNGCIIFYHTDLMYFT